MAKGLILIPKRFDKEQIVKIKANYVKEHYIKWRLLFQELAKHFKFEIQYVVDTPNIPKDVDIIITFSTPQHTAPMVEVCKEILKLPAGVKVIGFMLDIQCYNRPTCKRYMRRMFNRFDKILVISNCLFEDLYPKYIHKKIWVPHFFGPHDAYAKLPFNKNPLIKCLIPGARNKHYPLRDFIYKSKHPYNPYICYKSKIPYEKYPKVLNLYFCCVGTPGFYKSHVAKNIEIPAAGSLLLSETTKDILNLGFKPYKHYIPITEENVFKQIIECTRNHKDYTEIRKRARRYVINNYSIKNRIAQVKNIIKEVLNN